MMKIKNTPQYLGSFVLFSLIILSSACGRISSGQNQPDMDRLYTQAAETLYPQLTHAAGQTAEIGLTQMAGQTTPTPTASPTRIPSETPIQPVVQFSPTAVFPSLTYTPIFVILQPTSTATPQPRLPTIAPPPCDRAQLIRDNSIPDGTVFMPGASLTKSWRVKNTGSCTWTPNYALVFSSGDRMQGKKNISLGVTIRPGETVDLAVDLVAPLSKGIYRGYWMLSNASGRNFGIGDSADKAFWVDIRVVAGSGPFAYDFAQNMCAATWQSSAGFLRCAGDKADPRGSILFTDSPVLENGKHENEQTLWMRPEAVKGGWIMGVYPLYTVRQYDHFMADIGCLEGYKGCDLIFSLSYQGPGIPTKSLGSWHEVYDRAIKRIVIDLSELSGKQVSFVLSVTNQGAPSDANAFWLVPSIRRVSPVSSPTMTNTPTPTTTSTTTPTATIIPTETSTSPPTATATDTATPTEIAIQITPNSIAVKAAWLHVAQSLALKPNQVMPVSVEPAIWKDTCLGVDNPEIICEPATIPGYKIVFRAQGKFYEVHTNQDGSLIYWFEILPK